MSNETPRYADRHLVYARILVTFLTIVLVIDGLAVGIFLSGSRILRQKAHEAMLSQIQFTVDKLERAVERLYLLQVELVNDDRFQRIAVLPESLTGYDRIRIFLDVEARLTALESLTEYVSDVIVYLPETATRIASGRTASPIPPGEWTRLVLEQSEDSLISSVEEDLYLLFQHPTSTRQRRPSFVAAAKLSRDALIRLLPAVSEQTAVRARLFGTTQTWQVTGDQHGERFSVDWADIEAGVIDQLRSGRSSGVLAEPAGDSSSFAAFAHSQTLGACLVWQSSAPELVPVRSLLFTLLAILILASILGVPVFSLMIYRLVHVPVLHLVRSLGELERGNLGIHAEYRGRNEFEYVRQAFNSMSTRLSNLFDEVYQQRVLAQEADLRALQAQINPHFLYNSLFVLYRIIQSDRPDAAAGFTRDLAQYYEAMTRSAADEVSLTSDVGHARLYCNIQSVRLGERVVAHLGEIPHEVGVLPVPRLSFQPIVENCYKHAFQDPDRNGEIYFSYERFDDRWIVLVEDNGGQLSDSDIEHLNGSMQMPAAASDGRMSALYNVHRRVQLLYGREAGLFFRRSVFGGLAVQMTLIKEP